MGHWIAEPVIQGECEKVYEACYSSWEKSDDEYDHIEDVNKLLNGGWHIESISGLGKDHAFCIHLKKSYYSINPTALQ